jgi:hypothetical protein
MMGMAQGACKSGLRLAAAPAFAVLLTGIEYRLISEF